jgi:hypothetical protein
VQTCAELEKVLTAAGMQTFLAASVAEDGWVPGVTRIGQIKDKSHPCRGSVARKHSHFFTASGGFGSNDENGRPVDDGSYELVGTSDVVIGDPPVTFHYRISTDGTRLTLDPVIPGCRPGCFEARWSVQVAFPGYTWTRIS